jgi:type I restriction enzyme S subunit
MKAEPKHRFRSEFLFWLLSSDKVQSDVIGQSQRTAGQSGVNLDYLNSYPVYLPPQQLQIEFEERMSAVSKLHDDLVVSQQSLGFAFASLQHRAFSGQL